MRPPNEFHAEVYVLPPNEDEISKPASEIGPNKRIDMTQPISVTQETEIMINGKKCILRPHPDTGELFAYPVIGKVHFVHV